MNTTPGQAAYIEDCKRKPNYHDKTKRKEWEQLGEPEKRTWEQNPTARAYTCDCSPVTVNGERIHNFECGLFEGQAINPHYKRDDR